MAAMERSMPNEQLFAAQLELLMGNLAAVTVLAHGAGVVVAVMFLSAVVRPEFLYAWAVFVFAVIIVRSWHMRVCLRKRLTEQALVEQTIEHHYSSVSQFITVSQGLATADPAERLTSHELVARVDEALYSAKREGRDTIRAA
jgi:GGDEF domain-containing protein